MSERAEGVPVLPPPGQGLKFVPRKDRGGGSRDVTAVGKNGAAKGKVIRLPPPCAHLPLHSASQAPAESSALLAGGTSTCKHRGDCHGSGR